MSAPGFKSVFMVASCAGAALACYLVSLRVASERAALEAVETEIVIAQRDLRVLETEIGTRGRLAQLERWNVRVLALSAPSADQILGGSFELARMIRPEKTVDFDAPVVLAAAPREEPVSPIRDPQVESDSDSAPLAPSAMMREASLKTGTREVPARAAAQMPRATASKSSDQPAAAAKPVDKKSVDKPGLAAAKAVTKPVRIAKAETESDPLAPLPDKRPAKSTKDSSTAR